MKITFFIKPVLQLWTCCSYKDPMHTFFALLSTSKLQCQKYVEQMVCGLFFYVLLLVHQSEEKVSYNIQRAKVAQVV